MPGTQAPHGPIAAWLGAGRAAARRASAGACLIAATAALASCASAPANPVWIKVASAYVMQSPSAGSTDAYLVIANSGSADQLLSARSSAGGTIILRGPVTAGTSEVRTVSTLSIPGHSLVRLGPGGIHLVISQPGHMRDGADITLTLVFARAGVIKVLAEVTNPQTGGNTYFGS